MIYSPTRLHTHKPPRYFRGQHIDNTLHPLWINDPVRYAQKCLNLYWFRCVYPSRSTRKWKTCPPKPLFNPSVTRCHIEPSGKSFPPPAPRSAEISFPDYSPSIPSFPRGPHENTLILVIVCICACTTGKHAITICTICKNVKCKNMY